MSAVNINMTNKEIRQKTQMLLNFRYKGVLGVLAIYYLITMAVGFIVTQATIPFLVGGEAPTVLLSLRVINLLAIVFFVAPLGVGMTWLFLDCIRDEEIKIKNMFKVFNTNYWKVVGLNALAGIYIFLWWILLLGIPVLAIRKSYSYSQINYILRDNPDMSIREIIRHSKNKMSGKKMELFKLQFSYVWVILASYLSVFLSGILGVFIISITASMSAVSQSTVWVALGSLVAMFLVFVTPFIGIVLVIVLGIIRFPRLVIATAYFYSENIKEKKEEPVLDLESILEDKSIEEESNEKRPIRE